MDSQDKLMLMPRPDLINEAKIMVWERWSTDGSYERFCYDASGEEVILDFGKYAMPPFVKIDA